MTISSSSSPKIQGFYDKDELVWEISAWYRIMEPRSTCPYIWHSQEKQKPKIFGYAFSCLEVPLFLLILYSSKHSL